MSVHGMLVSGEYDARMKFWLALAPVANFFDTRGSTTHFAIFGENRSAAIECAGKLGLTLQEIHGAADTESYELLVGDEATAWKPKARRKKKARDGGKVAAHPVRVTDN